MIAPRSICTAACVAAHSRIARNALRFSDAPDCAPITKQACSRNILVGRQNSRLTPPSHAMLYSLWRFETNWLKSRDSIATTAINRWRRVPFCLAPSSRIPFFLPFFYYALCNQERRHSRCIRTTLSVDQSPPLRRTRTLSLIMLMTFSKEI